MALRRRHTQSGEFNIGLDVSPPPGAVAKVFRDMADELKNFRPVWRKLAPVLGKGLVRNIDGRGAPLGITWPQPNAIYTSRKVLEGHPDEELVLTGRTKRTLAKGPITKMSKTRLEVGLRGKKWGHIPAVNFGSAGQTEERRFMSWSPGMVKAANSMLDEHADALLRKAGRSMQGAT